VNVNIDSIQASPYQPRLTFDKDDLKEEIEKDGLLIDLIVRKQGDCYELIDGERRWHALKELGWKSVPVQVINASDTKARLLVFKLNRIRENYTVEEEARYFKKLADEGMTPLEISKQLTVDFHWVSANLNVFKFPENIQETIWTKQISISHLIALESAIGRNSREAVLAINQILEKKLTVSETRKVIQKRDEEIKARVNEARIKAAEKALPAVATRIPKLETSEDFENAADALKEMAGKIREGTLMRENKISARIEGKEAEGKTTERAFEEVSIQAVKSLGAKIEVLENERASLIERKGFLTEELSFSCPHCNHSCVIYREGEDYWVE
jgi:ParB family chromosome partitioning protein